MDISEIKKAMARKKKVETVPVYLSTGSRALNVSCSGLVNGGLLLGHYHLIVGDSASGKTWISHSLLAEAVHDHRFDDYQIYYDDAERGSLMDVERFFGTKLKNRKTLPPLGTSTTIEHFYFNADKVTKSGKPFIYVLDSMDALDSEQNQEHLEKSQEKWSEGKDSPGSYGDGKAKKNSSWLRTIVSELHKTNSMLVIIAQTRDSLKPFQEKQRAGGKSLRFYATMELWTSTREKLKKTVNKKERQIGITVQVTVKKNRQNGQEISCQFPIYWSYGIDDLGSCVDYLVEEKHWKREKGGTIHPVELDFSGDRELLIQHIESTGSEKVVYDAVQYVWDQIRQSCEVERKRRYE